MCESQNSVEAFSDVMSVEKSLCLEVQWILFSFE